MSTIYSACQQKIRLAVITDSISKRSGGIFWSVSALSMEAIRSGCDVSVFACEDENSSEDKASWEGTVLQLSKVLGPRFFGYQRDLVSKINKYKPDVAHQHGLWMYPSLVGFQLTKHRIPYIVSPHGMLDGWALKNSSWKKSIARFLYEDRNLAGARCIQALCLSEMRSMRAIGIKSPIAVIPNGIDIPKLSGLDKPKWSQPMPSDAKVALFLGRIHPKKGLVELLKAWSLCKRNSETSPSNWMLVISGWDQNGHEEELKKITSQLGISENVKFIGPSFNDEKAACFQHADAFILPSYSEGLPIAALEAWSYGLPVLMTPQCNLPEGFDAGAAIHIDPISSSIAQGLYRLFKMSDSDRVVMGARGLSLVKEKFQWSTISVQMNDVYRWMIGLTPPPPCINFYENHDCK